MARSKRDVLIVGLDEYTTGNRARRFVKHGRAEWIDATRKAIRFVTSFHTPVSSEQCVAAQRWQPCYRTTEAAACGPWPGWFDRYETGAAVDPAA